MELQPPARFEPQNDLERSICEALEACTESEVFTLQTHADYLASGGDLDYAQKDFDYIANTAIRWNFNGLPRAGEIVGVRCTEQEIALEIVARWFT